MHLVLRLLEAVAAVQVLLEAQVLKTADPVAVAVVQAVAAVTQQAEPELPDKALLVEIR